MPTLSPTRKVIAILCSDIHLSLTPPLARAGEPSWFNAMARSLGELRGLSETHGAPILCAGDIFDKWNPSPELINFAIEHLPPMYAIPGQHDLPLHALADITKSAYWTLVKTGNVKHMKEHATQVGGMDVYGFAWGEEIEPPTPSKKSNRTQVALIHKYTWMDGHGYAGAPEDHQAKNNKYHGYDVAVIGDNHKGFCTEIGGTTVFNCGGFMRRKSDELTYRPWVGLLHEDVTVTYHHLDITKDEIDPTVKDETTISPDLTQFLKEIKELHSSALDYRTKLEQVMLSATNMEAETKNLIREALENGKTK